MYHLYAYENMFEYARFCEFFGLAHVWMYLAHTHNTHTHTHKHTLRMCIHMYAETFTRNTAQHITHINSATGPTTQDMSDTLPPQVFTNIHESTQVY